MLPRFKTAVHRFLFEIQMHARSMLLIDIARLWIQYSIWLWNQSQECFRIDELFRQLLLLERCSPLDVDEARAELDQGLISEREMFAKWRLLALPNASKVWLTGFGQHPLLNDEFCEILGFETDTRFFRLRRLCCRSEMLVGKENITSEPPDGTGAVVSIRAVLSRVISRDLAKKVMSFMTWERCWRPCCPDTRCIVDCPTQREFLRGDPSIAFYTVGACSGCQRAVLARSKAPKKIRSSHARPTSRCSLEEGHSIYLPQDCDSVDPKRLRSPHVIVGSLRWPPTSITLPVFNGLPPYVESVTSRLLKKIDLSCFRHSCTRRLENQLAETQTIYPYLKRLDLSRVNMDIRFFAEITPNLESIFSRSCCMTGALLLPFLKYLELNKTRVTGELVLPSLEVFHVRNSFVPRSLLKPVLALAVNLKSFKLEYCGIRDLHLHLSSRSLERVYIVRAVGPTELRIWAPRLKGISVRSCDQLKSIVGLGNYAALVEIRLHVLAAREELNSRRLALAEAKGGLRLLRFHGRDTGRDVARRP